MIVDKTQGKLDEIRQFADSINKRDNLENCIKNLDYGSDKYVVEIFTDFAPKSLYFVRKCIGDERFAGNGGVIFHGRHDNGGDGSSPTLSVSIDPNNELHWQVHT